MTAAVMATMASRPICQSRFWRACIAWLIAWLIACCSRWWISLSCWEERRARRALVICRSLTSRLMASWLSRVDCFSLRSICFRILATFPATLTGVERVSVTAWLLSRLMLSVSACSFLKASARRRKKPLRVFITSTVVFFAT